MHAKEDAHGLFSAAQSLVVMVTLASRLRFFTRRSRASRSIEDGSLGKGEGESEGQGWGASRSTIYSSARARRVLHCRRSTLCPHRAQ